MAYPDNSLNIKTSLTPAAGIAFFFCAFLLLFVVFSFISTFIMMKMSNEVAALRIATLLQDIFIFILPALVTALLMTRVPARFLFIDTSPQIWNTAMSLIILFLAMPWLNEVIEWNNSFTLPESMKDLELKLREAEDTAAEFINNMLRGSSIASLLISIAIIGIMAALSEELFFRGALLRLFLMTRMNHHLAIWIVAVIFSLMHFQFFGFIPRMLLGAYFGYLVWWTRCLWIPIIVHAVNNSVVVVAQWHEANSTLAETESDSTSAAFRWTLFGLSILITIICLYIFNRRQANVATSTIQK